MATMCPPTGRAGTPGGREATFSFQLRMCGPLQASHPARKLHYILVPCLPEAASLAWPPALRRQWVPGGSDPTEDDLKGLFTENPSASSPTTFRFEPEHFWVAKDTSPPCVRSPSRSRGGSWWGHKVPGPWLPLGEAQTTQRRSVAPMPQGFSGPRDHYPPRAAPSFL